MVERFAQCIECLQAARSIDLAQVHGVVLAVSRCARCIDKDRTGDKLIARLARREDTRRTLQR